MTQICKITWNDIDIAASLLANRHKAFEHKAVWGVPTGGSVIAPFVAHYLGVPVCMFRSHATLIVDDLVDSGATLTREAQDNAANDCCAMVDALFRKPTSPIHIARHASVREGWLHFPWEKEARPEDAVTRLLQFVGEDPLRDGLKDTPARVCRALREMTEGYGQRPDEILGRVFEERYDEVIILRGIPFASTCEHHLLPFVGSVDIGYIPGKVVGLSKLARLVDCFARRLQLQERLTREIADAIAKNLGAQGVAVVVKAEHTCMACRGVRKPGSVMVTSAMLGAFREKAEARAEFLGLCK